MEGRGVLLLQLLVRGPRVYGILFDHRVCGRCSPSLLTTTREKTKHVINFPTFLLTLLLFDSQRQSTLADAFSEQRDGHTHETERILFRVRIGC